MDDRDPDRRLGARLAADALAGPRRLARGSTTRCKRGARRRARSPTACSSIFGGALLLTPGFLSDILGLLFLLPPTRAVIRRVFLREAMKRITVTMAAGAQMPRDGGRGRRADDVEGTAVDADPPARLQP